MRGVFAHRGNRRVGKRNDMVTYRPIVALDATTIAYLHATSWRSAYRGILPDEYLEDDIEADRLTHWRCRLSAPTERDVGVLALE